MLGSSAAEHVATEELEGVAVDVGATGLERRRRRSRRPELDQLVIVEPARKPSRAWSVVRQSVPTSVWLRIASTIGVGGHLELDDVEAVGLARLPTPRP